MSSDQTGKRSRNIFTTSNKYQERIIFLTFFPSLLIFLSFSLIVAIGNPFIAHAELQGSFWSLEKLVNQFALWMVILMCLTMFFSIIASFIISHRMIGAYNRIIHEVDEIIAGRSEKIIQGRPHDDLTNEFLKRINILTQVYIKSKNDKGTA